MDLQSILGYAHGSPFSNSPYLDINTPQGLIDMSNTPIDLMGVDNMGNVKKMKAGRKNPYRFQGSKVREIPMQVGGQPTRQDSLNLYNNTNALLNYYRGRKYKEETGAYDSDYMINTPEDIENYFKQGRDVFNIANREGVITYPTRDNQSAKGRIPSDMYYKKLDDNKFYQREQAAAILDTRAPMGLYDKRITPTKGYDFLNVDRADPLNNDRVSIFGYDPSLIKPYDMLTPQERIQRDKILGRNPSTPPAVYKKPQRPIRATDVEDVNYEESPISVQGSGYKPMDFSQQPTKYSLTYRDETSPTKDRSIYFDTLDQWRAAVNSPYYKALSTEEGNGRATASGYKLQSGGYNIGDDVRKFKGFPDLENMQYPTGNIPTYPFNYQQSPEFPIYSTSSKKGTYLGIGADVPNTNAYLDLGAIRYAGDQGKSVMIPSVSAAYGTPIGDVGFKWNPENNLRLTYSTKFKKGGKNPYQQGGVSRKQLFDFLFDDEETPTKPTETVPTAPSTEEVDIQSQMNELAAQRKQLEEDQNNFMLQNILMDSNVRRGNPYATGRASAGVNPYVAKTQQDIMNPYGLTNLGIWGDQSHQMRASDHNTGDAQDFGFNDIKTASSAVSKLQQEAKQRNIKYIIFNGKIWNPSVSNEWRPYNGPDPHNTHFHVSYNR